MTKVRAEALRVLLIEDDEEQAELVRLQIAKSAKKYDVIVAGSISAAMYEMQEAIASKKSFQQILLDRWLPDVRTDQQFAEAYSRLQQLMPRAKIVVMTGSSDPSLSKWVQSHGGSFVHKDEQNLLLQVMDKLRAEKLVEQQIAADKSERRRGEYMEIVQLNAEQSAEINQLKTQVKERLEEQAIATRELRADLNKAIAAIGTELAAIRQTQSDAASRGQIRQEHTKGFWALMLALVAMLGTVGTAIAPKVIDLLKPEVAKTEVGKP